MTLSLRSGSDGRTKFNMNGVSCGRGSCDGVLAGGSDGVLVLAGGCDVLCDDGGIVSSSSSWCLRFFEGGDNTISPSPLLESPEDGDKGDTGGG